MKKAEHQGHCQLCGRQQMLPAFSGTEQPKLSLHGYTKQWGFFNGTCPGSRELPYEQSCALLPPRILSVQADIERLKGWAQEIRATTDKVWVHEYVRSQGRMGSYYKWREIAVVDMLEIG